MSFKIALIGRPNVGKSTLFNRLAGKKLALTHDLPGLTRDFKEADANIGPLKFSIVDTAGLEISKKGTLTDRMLLQTEKAMHEVDLCLFMLDYKVGVVNEDVVFKKWLHKSGLDVKLVYNKSEKFVAHDEKIKDAMKLGFGEPIFISAEHNDGMLELYDLLEPLIEDSDNEEPKAKADLTIAIVGRPNAGKSTLVNSLVGSERLLTGPEPGITRDSIALNYEYQGKQIKLVDTAGLRKKAKIVDNLEELTVKDSIRAINFAEAVILVVDAEIALERQDLIIANQVIKEGRSLILAVNKADLIEDKKAYIDELKYKISRNLPELKNLQPVLISAMKKQNLDDLLQIVVKTHAIWNKRISTSKLNDWLIETVRKHPVPLGKRNLSVKLKYISQIKKRPPTFMISTTKPNEVPRSYQRYILNGLIEQFGFYGVPIRVFYRKPKNPYA